jgi:hypothetical protein
VEIRFIGAGGSLASMDSPADNIGLLPAHHQRRLQYQLLELRLYVASQHNDNRNRTIRIEK